MGIWVFIFTLQMVCEFTPFFIYLLVGCTCGTHLLKNSVAKKNIHTKFLVARSILKKLYIVKISNEVLVVVKINI